MNPVNSSNRDIVTVSYVKRTTKSTLSAIREFNALLDQESVTKSPEMKNNFFPVSLIDFFQNDPISLLKSIYKKYPLSQDLGIDPIEVDNVTISFKSVISGDALQEKKQKQLADFFEGDEKQILIYESAGKKGTNFYNYLLQQWANGTVWADKFEAVYSFSIDQLKNFSAKHDLISSFVLSSFKGLDEEFDTTSIEKHFIETKKNKILLVIDGGNADFTQGQLPEFLAQLNNYPYWILLTSANNTLQIDVDTILESNGIAIKSISDAIDKLCNKMLKEEAIALDELIHRNSLLLTIAHDPVLLKAICLVFANGYLKIKPDLTLTEVYSAFVSYFTDQALKAINNDRTSLALFEEKLDADAWEDFQGQQSISMIDLRHKHYQSFLHPFQFGSADFYLLFSEFLTARHLSRIIKANPKEAKKIISEKMFCHDYQKIFRFVAGLLKEDPIALNHFLDILDQQKDPVNLYSVLLKIGCFEESGWSDRKFDNHLCEIESWCLQILNPGSWHLIKNAMIDTFTSNPKGAEKVFFPILRRALSHQDKEIRREAIEALAALQICPDFVSPILNKNLAFREEGMRQAVIDGFCRSKMNRIQMGNAILLIGALFTDQDPLIVLRAIEFLDKVGIYNPKWSVIWLANGLMHHSPKVKDASANTLKKLGKRVPEDAMDILERVFNPQNLYINSKLFEVLPELLQVYSIGVEWVLPVLKKALLQNEEKAWYLDSTMRAYEKIGQIHTERVIAELLPLLSSSTLHRKKCLVPILGKLGRINPKQALCLFEDELKGNLQIGIYLVEALGYFGRNVSNEVISFFSKILQQDNEELKEAAIKAIERIGHNQESLSGQAVLPLLLDQEEGESALVATARMRALGKVGRADPLKIFSKFFLKRDASDIQLNIQIVKAFGRVGRASPIIADHLVEDMLSNLSEEIKVESLLNLTKIRGNHLATTIPSLVDLFKIASHDEKCRTIKVLGNLWEKAPEVALAGIAAALDEHYHLEVKKCAVQAIFQIARTNFPNVSSLLLTTFSHPDPDVAIEAICSLPKLRHLEPSFLMSCMEEAFQSKSKNVIREAILVLGRLKPNSQRQTLPFLQNWIKESEVRKEVYCALNQFDLSSFPKLLTIVLEDYYVFQQSCLPLSFTPLWALLKNYVKSIKGEQKTNYLLAAIIKSISENQAIFFEMNALCVFEKGQIHRIEVDDPVRGKREIEEAFYLHKENHLISRAQKLKDQRHYSLAGYYYKQAVCVDEMFASYEWGVENNEVEALYALGLLFHAGIGCEKSLKENYQGLKDLKKAKAYYTLAHNQQHAASTRMLGCCYEYGLGVDAPDLELSSQYYGKAYGFVIEQKLDDIPIDVPHHCFMTMPIPFLVDENKELPAAGTIGLALGSLESDWIRREVILNYLKQNKRPDIELEVPCVSVSKQGDLLIDLSKKLAKNRSMLDKFSKMGLSATSIKHKKYNKQFVIRYLVPRCEIRHFLLNKLWLHSAVYDNLLEFYPQIKENAIQ